MLEDTVYKQLAELLLRLSAMPSIRDATITLQATAGFRGILYPAVTRMINERRGSLESLLPPALHSHFKRYTDFCARMQAARRTRAARTLYYPWVETIHRFRNPDGTLRMAARSLSASLEGRLL
jgi:hypothetical protein